MKTKVIYRILFDRFDICEAYLALEHDWHIGGILRERPRNSRDNKSTDVQLRRMGFRPSPLWGGKQSLSENGLAIYQNLERRYGLI